jgi:predicted transport protein
MMADPQSATATQIRNIEDKTGKTLAQLCQLIADSGLAKIGEQRTMLMQTLGLGYGDANTLALRAKEVSAPALAGGDPLDTIYAGPKAPLRELHERLSAEIDKLGTNEKAPKKTYVSLRRKKQFAMLGPATKDQVELGLNVKGLPASTRLKALPPGGMCQYTVRLSRVGEIDAELMAWVRAAYEAAG